MILPDINVLIYAHRTDSPHHKRAAEHITALAESLTPFALCSFVCTGFVRIVTNHRIFREPTSLEQAIAFIESLTTLDHCRRIEPGERHWQIFKALLQEAKATGNLVSDAYLSAIAIEHGCDLLTGDTDFAKFRALRVRLVG